MTKTLVVRGVDDHIHEQLGDMASQHGMSINSIVRDAVDLWLNFKKSGVRKKHHLIIYSDDRSMLQLIKSMDRLTIEDNLTRCFFGPPNNPSAKLLTKLNWYNATTMPYYYSPFPSSKSIENKKEIDIDDPIRDQGSIEEYCNKVIENVIKNSRGKQICCLDFLMNDVHKDSLKQTLALEKAYDDDRLTGLMYCTYKSDNLFNSEITDLLELFEMHDQIFILRKNEVYKLHITKENIHKLFLN